MITAYAPVAPNRRPAYIRLFGPYESRTAADQPIWFSFFDHTKDRRFLEGGKWRHNQLEYWTYDYQRQYYDLHFIDQKELIKDFSERYRATFKITRMCEYGNVKIVPFTPMFDKIVYTPALGYEGMDSFTVQPLVPERGFTGQPFTLLVQVGNPSLT